MKLKRMFYQIIVAFCAFQASAPFPKFYADLPFLDYLNQSLCPATHESARTHLVLIENARIATLESYNQNVSVSLYPTLQSFKCVFIYSTNETLDSFYSQINSSAHFAYKQLLIVFNFPQQLRHQEFVIIIHALARFYRKCDKCRPFLLNFSNQELINWISMLYNELYSKFQATFIVRDSAAFHLRPILNGCHMYPGLYRPETFEDFRLMRISYKKCNLNETSINVSMFAAASICEYSQLASGEYVLGQGFGTQILLYLMRKFHFRIEIFDVDEINHRLGIKHYRQYMFTVHFIQNETTEFGTCAIIHRPEQTFVEFSRPLVQQDVTFLSQDRVPASRDWILWRLFQRETGQLFAVSYLALAFLLMVIAHVNRTPGTRNWILQLYGVCLNQSTQIWQERAASVRLIFLIAMTTSLIATQIYNSYLYSILTVPEFEPRIDTEEDLFRATRDLETHDLIISETFPFFRNILEAEKGSGFWYQLKPLIERSKSKHFLIPTIEDIIPLIEQSPKHIVLDLRLNLEIAKAAQASRPVHVGSQEMYKYFLVMALARRSPLLQPFNMAILETQEAGLMELWSKRAQTHYIQMHRRANRSKKSREVENQLKVLSLKDLKSIFTFWSIGMGNSGLVWSVEMIGFFLNCRKKIDF